MVPALISNSYICSSPLYPWNFYTCQLLVHLSDIASVDDDDALDGMHGEWCTTYDRRIPILTFPDFLFLFAMADDA